jgi:hypothetical protein
MGRGITGLGLLCLLSVAVAAGTLLISLPRAVEPNELPALILDSGQVTAQEQLDAQQAKAATSPEAEQLSTLFHSLGASEVVALDNFHLADQRRRTLHSLYVALREKAGQDAVVGARARALANLEAALAGELKGPEVKGWLGVFPNVLEQYQATRDGLELAPHFVVRTLYKARWNKLCNLPPEADLTPIERQAYFGWLGLHASNVSLAERRQALLEYAAAGGEHADQAQGVLAYLDRDYATAAQAFERAYAKHPSLRLRNYLRGVEVVAGHLSGAPSVQQSQRAQVDGHN